MSIKVPNKKIERLASLASKFLSNSEVTANELRSFIGRAESVRPAAELALSIIVLCRHYFPGVCHFLGKRLSL